MFVFIPGPQLNRDPIAHCRQVRITGRLMPDLASHHTVHFLPFIEQSREVDLSLTNQPPQNPLLIRNLSIRICKEVSPSQFSESHLLRVQTGSARSERAKSCFVTTPGMPGTSSEKYTRGGISRQNGSLPSRLPSLPPPMSRRPVKRTPAFSFPQSDFRPAQKPVDSPAWDTQIETT